MQEIMDIIFNYGVGFACVGYLIYDKLTFSKKIINEIVENNKETIKALDNINNSLTLMNERINNLEKKGE